MENVVVSLTQGKLRGSVSTDINEETFYKFQGIPYAKPPLGELRFKAPQPPEKWNGILDATKEGSSCYSQHPFRKNVRVGSENCLFLNVYTKSVTGALRPVLFWIHGGAFLNGSGGEEFYGPDFLITEDIVLVTINYRIGIFGFLSLENPTLNVPGNAGLKDVVMALKWVQNNIKQFGGDSSNVTIFGQSAGGVTAHLLMLSKMGRGLFHKAIAQSGCALHSWARGTTGVKEIVSHLKLEDSSEETVYSKLMELSMEELHEIQDKIINFHNTVPSLHRAFAFVIENSNNEEAFLTEEPLDIILSGNFYHVPFIIGHTSAETAIFDLFREPIWPGSETMEYIISWDWGYKLGSKESLAVTERLKTYYFGTKKLGEISNKDKIPLHTDVAFVYGIYITVMIHICNSEAPVYLYKMSAETELNVMRKMFYLRIPGAVHYDDIGYLFKNTVTPERKLGSKEEIVRKRFVRLWTNFAKFGNPTPNKNDSLLNNVEWQPVTDDKLDYLHIGNELSVMSDPVDRQRINFLKQLYKESPGGQKWKDHF